MSNAPAGARPARRVRRARCRGRRRRRRASPAHKPRPPNNPTAREARLKAERAKLQALRAEREQLEQRRQTLQYTVHDLSEEVAQHEPRSGRDGQRRPLARRASSMRSCRVDEHYAGESRRRAGRARDQARDSAAPLGRHLQARAALLTRGDALGEQLRRSHRALQVSAPHRAARPGARAPRRRPAQPDRPPTRQTWCASQSDMEENRQEKADEEQRLRDLQAQQAASLHDAQRSARLTDRRIRATGERRRTPHQRHRVPRRSPRARRAGFAERTRARPARSAAAPIASTGP